MAVAPHRRHPNLRLELPDPTSNHSHPFFPLPSSSSASSSSSSSSVPFADLEKLSVLGHGNSGTVYKVKHKRTSAVYALKVVRGDSDAVLRRRSLREVDILRRASDSPHVVRLHGTFERPCGTVGILMEYMDIGTLDTVVKNYGPLGESDLANVARQVLHGLDYLHSNKIIHRDIKPSNLLVNSKMEVKIADFGVSKIMCRTLDACDSYVGTCAYMSPERFDPDSNGGSYDGYAGDVWGLGLTLLELYLGYFPFLNPGQTPDWASLVCAICIGEPPRLPESAGAEFRSFVECCLRKESSERWRVTQLLTHPFVTKDRSVDS